MSKNKSKPGQLILLILALILAAALVFSRGQRHAKRIKIDKQQPEYTNDIPEEKIIETKDTEEIISQMTPIDLLLGKTSHSNSELLIEVPSKFASREGIFMNKQAFEAFFKMYESALKDGIKLVILSGYRSFDHQKRIWENKWNGRQILHGNIKATDVDNHKERALEILKFSAMPGTSRHHWGTDVDLNSLNNSYFKSGEGKRVYDWLELNAANYGFCQPYTAKGAARNKGYEEEKWHWSYLPIANEYLKHYKKVVGYDSIAGFDGFETAKEIGVIEKFVLSIDSQCIDKY